MAFLRNGHEVIRASMEECMAAKDLPAFKEEWSKLIHWQEIHACMEEGKAGAGKGFFAVLEEAFPGTAVTCAQARDSLRRSLRPSLRLCPFYGC